MSCRHRFYDKLIPEWPIKYLFIGTFNPEWNSGNDAAYFYGRPQNRFWEIMPIALNFESQIKNRSNPEVLELFLKKNKIGLTDLIVEVTNADYKVASHRRALLSFKDDELFRFKCKFNENIFDLIDKNAVLLQQGGVFLTRKSTPKGSIGLFWQHIINFANIYGIRTASLISHLFESAKF
ncbi:MAG TPA: hypothetical protein P5270_04225 [Victivallales bacterium]|nr:hypothetical protein [Victivallales bacterium]